MCRRACLCFWLGLCKYICHFVITRLIQGMKKQPVISKTLLLEEVADDRRLFVGVQTYTLHLPELLRETNSCRPCWRRAQEVRTTLSPPEGLQGVCSAEAFRIQVGLFCSIGGRLCSSVMATRTELVSLPSAGLLCSR